MSTAQPTEGEWEASGLGVMSRRDGIAFDLGSAEFGEHVRYGEACANAHLFAASKNLLAELEFAYVYLKKETGGSEWNAGIERMRAAIEKAKGEA